MDLVSTHHGVVEAAVPVLLVLMVYQVQTQLVVLAELVKVLVQHQ